MFNIGVLGSHLCEGLGSKYYRAVVLYEGCSLSIFTCICVHLYWLCAVIVCECGFKQGVTYPLFEPVK